MRIPFGARVVDSEGKAVGTVCYVVLQSDARQVKGIVVHQGITRTREVIVPISRVTDTRDSVRLTLTAADLDSLPIFDSRHSAVMPTGGRERWVGPMHFPPVPGAGYWSGQSTDEPTEHEHDAGKGTVVCDNTGRRIGHVEAIDMAAASKTITSITVRHGHLSAHAITVPVSMIKSITDRITLSVAEALLPPG